MSKPVTPTGQPEQATSTLTRPVIEPAVRVLLFGLLGVAAFTLLNYTVAIWRPFFIAFTLAYLLNPLVVRLERRLGRSLAVVVTVFVLTVSGALVVLLLAQVAGGLLELPRTLLFALERLPDWYETGAPLWLREVVDGTVAELGRASELPGELPSLDDVSGVLRGSLGALLGSLGGLAGALFQGVILFTLTVFTLAGYPLIARSLLEAFPRRYGPRVRELAAKLDTTAGAYVRAKLVQALIVGLVYWLVLALLGVPRAGALGFLAGLLNPIPYLGPLVTISVVTLSALTVSWQTALTALVLLVILDQLDGNLLGPVLLSEAVKVQPVVVLLSVVAGGTLFGLWGVVLAVPATAFLQVLYRDLYKTSRFYQQLPREVKRQDTV